MATPNVSTLEKYDLVDYDNIDKFLENKRRIYYNFKATTGFIIGVILDNIIPSTFGFITMNLKRFGKLWYSCKIENKYINQLTKNKYVGWFVRGFLE